MTNCPGKEERMIYIVLIFMITATAGLIWILSERENRYDAEQS